MPGRNLPLIALAAFTLVACSSLPDLTFGGPDAATTGDGSTGDGGGTTGCSCQNVPAGWTAVLFTSSSQQTCPSDTVATDLRVMSGDGTPSCSCSCSGGGGSCANGNFTLTLSGEATCGVTPTTVSIPSDAASCTPLGNSITVPAVAFAKVSHVAPTSCTANASSMTRVSGGRMCEARAANACGAGQACAPSSMRNFQSCITKAGANDCPADFPRQSTAGASADDSQTCTGCACGAPTACTGGNVSIYDGSMCKTTGTSQGAVNIGTSCAATSDTGFTATHFRSNPAGGGCSQTPTTPPTPGKVTFTEQRTVCCR